MKTLRWFGFGLAIAIAGCSTPTATAPIAQASSPAIAQLPSPVWEIGWQVCDVINPRRVSERGCLPDMRAADNRPDGKVVLWADDIQTPDDVHIETTNSHITGVKSYLFVRSKGCLNSAPGNEDFYYTGVVGLLSTRRAEPPLPEARWTITPQQLNSEEAAQLVQVAQTQISGRRFRMMGSTGECLTLTQWREQNS
jgi:hypothetical protein